MSLSLNVARELDGFRLDMQYKHEAGILAILGESGSGKSMTLRMIAGIDTPDSGSVTLGGRALYDSNKRINLRPQARKVGYVFQSYALFPHMTVAQNIAIAAGGADVPGIIERFGLRGLESRLPGEISGGQQQRVALARSLVQQPELLLLDEPFSALDVHLRQQTRREVLELLRGVSVPVELVTHDFDEAYQMSERLVVIAGGRCVASGGTKALFDAPGLVSVAKLTGCGNISRARRVGEHRLFALDWGVELETMSAVTDGVTAVGVREYAPRIDTCGENLLPIERFELGECAAHVELSAFVGGGVPIVCRLDRRVCFTGAPMCMTIDRRDVLPLKSTEGR